jgi:hypothetical protein
MQSEVSAENRARKTSVCLMLALSAVHKQIESRARLEITQWNSPGVHIHPYVEKKEL